MSFSLYDAVIPSNLQILSALEKVLSKAEAFCEEGGMSAAELIDARLAPDMLPLGYQSSLARCIRSEASKAHARVVFLPIRMPGRPTSPVCEIFFSRRPLNCPRLIGRR